MRIREHPIYSHSHAVCCISLRHLRYLRENTHISVLTSFATTSICSPADLADYADKLQEQLSAKYMQPCYILCVICALCERITHISVLNLSARQQTTTHQRGNKNNKRDVRQRIPLLLSCNPYRAAK